MSQRTLKLFASAVIILNLLDAIFTLLYTSSGIASESNPMMGVALAVHPAVFMAAKLSLVSLCVLLLWRVGHRRLAMVALAGAAMMYTALLGYHLTAMPRLVAFL